MHAGVANFLLCPCLSIFAGASSAVGGQFTAITSVGCREVGCILFDLSCSHYCCSEGSSSVGEVSSQTFVVITASSLHFDY
jgi:hypothetical protein